MHLWCVLILLPIPIIAIALRVASMADFVSTEIHQIPAKSIQLHEFLRRSAENLSHSASIMLFLKKLCLACQMGRSRIHTPNIREWSRCKFGRGYFTAVNQLSRYESNFIGFMSRLRSIKAKAILTDKTCTLYNVHTTPIYIGFQLYGNAAIFCILKPVCNHHNHTRIAYTLFDSTCNVPWRSTVDHFTKKLGFWSIGSIPPNPVVTAGVLNTFFPRISAISSDTSL